MNLIQRPCMLLDKTMSLRNPVKLITSAKSFRRFSVWTKLGAAFNAKPGTQKSDFRKCVGLFGMPELSEAKGFYDLKAQCFDEADNLIGEAASDARSRKMVEVFDDLSNTLCKVADLAEFVRIGHPEQEYAKAAESATFGISQIIEKFNTNKNLYDALKTVLVSGDKFHTTATDNYVAKLFLFDFEQCGIHLPETERNKIVTLNDYILQLGQAFMSGTAKPIRKSLLPQYLKDVITFDEEDIHISDLNRDSTNPAVRELAYRVFFYPDPNQEYLLKEMLNARHHLALVCGFNTYAHRALKGSIMENPESVIDFLDVLSYQLKDRAIADFKLMENMKRSDASFDNNLAIWDVSYYVQKFKREKYQLHGSEFASYFSLGACMEGLSMLFKSLYAITLENVDVYDGEIWNADVYKIALNHENEGLLGYIYCDFYDRKGKPDQACHFTIRGGKCLHDNNYQLPVVVLMLNLPMPRESRPCLLSPSMVETLFHEMGHAMHSMLARTKYQHVSGTRCSTDFAEVPSILMEYFASDPRVLRKFAKHFQTGKPIPDSMLNTFCQSKHAFAASEMQLQLFYAALDQTYHKSPIQDATTTQILAEVQSNYYGLPHIAQTAAQLRFGHLVGYGAKYYSYLVSKALASWIWRTCFETDPFNRRQGERYRRECLAYGGSKPGVALVADFLKKQPGPELLADALISELDVKDYVAEKKI